MFQLEKSPESDFKARAGEERIPSATVSSAVSSHKALDSTNRTERQGEAEAERTESSTVVRKSKDGADQATLTPTQQSGSREPVTATPSKQAEFTSSTEEEKKDQSKEEPLEIKQLEGQ